MALLRTFAHYAWDDPLTLLTPDGVSQVRSRLMNPIHPTHGVECHSWATPRHDASLPNVYVARSVRSCVGFPDARDGLVEYTVVTSYIPTYLNDIDDEDEWQVLYDLADEADQADPYGHEVTVSSLYRAKVVAEALARRRQEGRDPHTGRHR